MIFIASDIWRKIRALLRTVREERGPCEFHAFGKIQQWGDGLLVVDLVVPQQEATASSASSNIDQMLAAVRERWQQALRDKGAEAARLESLAWRLWLHSHNSMQAFYSHDDHDSLRALAKASGWFAGIVVNDACETKSFIAVREPILVVHELGPAVVVEDEDPSAEAWARAALPNIKAKPPIVYQPWFQNMGGDLDDEDFCYSWKGEEIQEDEEGIHTGGSGFHVERVARWRPKRRDSRAFGHKA